jgi:small subunit ribosomal protein S17
MPLPGPLQRGQYKADDDDPTLGLQFPPMPGIPTPIDAFKTGVVVSDLSRKTLVVEVEHRFQHPLYKKIVVKHKKFHVHDEEEVGWIGDTVEIRPCRPRSALKRFELVRIVRQGEAKRSVWQVLPMKLVAEITGIPAGATDPPSYAIRFSLAPSQEELFPSLLPKTGRPLCFEVRFSGDMVELEKPQITLLYYLAKKWSSCETVSFSLNSTRHTEVSSDSEYLPSIEASVVFQNTLIQIRRFRLNPEQFPKRGE